MLRNNRPPAIGSRRKKDKSPNPGVQGPLGEILPKI